MPPVRDGLAVTRGVLPIDSEPEVLEGRADELDRLPVLDTDTVEGTEVVSRVFGKLTVVPGRLVVVVVEELDVVVVEELEVLDATVVVVVDVELEVVDEEEAEVVVVDEVVVEVVVLDELVVDVEVELLTTHKIQSSVTDAVWFESGVTSVDHWIAEGSM